MENVSQKSIFLEQEGDSFFTRNYTQLLNHPIPLSLQFYERYLKAEYRILEIGCSAGNNLQHFNQKFGSECYGIDPSAKAIAEGKLHYPKLHLSIGTADILEFSDGFFDFVLFGFCLYLTDRQLLTKIVAEADRVLKDKGYLGITDFDAKIPKKRPYKHYANVMSYKMDYPSLFLAFPHYSLADKFCFSHSGNAFVADIKERVSSTVLYKDFGSAYFPEDEQQQTASRSLKNVGKPLIR